MKDSHGKQIKVGDTIRVHSSVWDKDVPDQLRVVESLGELWLISELLTLTIENQDSLSEKLKGPLVHYTMSLASLTEALDALESICKEEVKSGQIEVWQKVTELYDDDTDEQFKWEHHDDFGSYAQAQISKLIEQRDRIKLKEN